MGKSLKALDVAKVFLHFSNENRTAMDCDDVTPMKLQKLLYYAQGNYLAEYGEELFKEKIYRWEYGPVVREVYDVYKSCGRNEIIEHDTVNSVDVEYLPFLSRIYNDYGKYTASQLSTMTHRETPWLETQQNKEIKKTLIKSFFSKIFEEKMEKTVSEVDKQIVEYKEFSLEDLKKLTDV